MSVPNPRKELATRADLKVLATKSQLKAAVAALATKDELAAAIAPLATKEELAAAIAPLATKEELHSAIAEAIAPLATKVGLEAMRVELAQHAHAIMQHVTDLFAAQAEQYADLPGRVTRLERHVGLRQP